MAELTQEEKISKLREEVRNTLNPIVSQTTTKGWTFKYLKQNYVILSYISMRIQYLEVYESTRAGRKTSTTPLVHIVGKSDHLLALESSIAILIP
jgi:hypothetical protein